VHHNHYIVNFQHFHLMQLNDKQNQIWKGMWVAIVGEIWKHRNGVIFKQGKVDSEEIFCMVQMHAYNILI